MRSFVLPPSCWQGWAGPFWELWAAKGHASRTLAAQAARAGRGDARRRSGTTWARSKGGSKSAFKTRVWLRLESCYASPSRPPPEPPHPALARCPSRPRQPWPLHVSICSPRTASADAGSYRVRARRGGVRPTLSPNPPSPLYRPSNPPHRSHAPVRVALLRTAWVCLCLHAQPNLNLVNLQPVSFRVLPRRAPNPPAMYAKPPNAAWQCHGPLRPRRQPYIRVSIPRTPDLRTPRPRVHRSPQPAPHSPETAPSPEGGLASPRALRPRRRRPQPSGGLHAAPLATRPHEQASWGGSSPKDGFVETVVAS
jgi:hypothetical protein